MQVTVTAIEGPTVSVSGGQEFNVAVHATPAPVVNVAVAGVQGPPGPTGVASVVATEALGGGRVVTGAGLYSQADTMGLVLGITTGAAVSGATVNVRVSGLMTEPGWNWVAGGMIFASPNGVLTQSPPVTGTLRQVARAIDNTSIIVDIQSTIVLG